METKKRYLDVYRGIAVFILFLSSFSWMKQEICIWASALGIPVLFAANGIECIDKINSKEKEEIIIKEFGRAYMIPYGIFTLFYIIVQAVSSSLGILEYSFDKGVWDIVESIILFGKSILWFFPVAFISSSIYTLIRRRLDLWKILLMFAALIICYQFIIKSIDILNAEEDMLFFFVGRVFQTVWRCVIADFFMAVGEAAYVLVNKTEKQLKSRVIIGIILFFSGTVCAVENEYIYIKSLLFGNTILFYFGTIMMITGLFIICEWIKEFPLFEFMGKSYIVILLSGVSYGLVSIGKVIDEKLLIVFDNKFIAHATSFISVWCIELILIYIIYRFLYFTLGYIKSINPYLVFKERNEED